MPFFFGFFRVTGQGHGSMKLLQMHSDAGRRGGVRKIAGGLLLCRALALEPELLLLDEPCAGMNAEEKQDMIFWVKDIQDELGVTILLIEHDMKVVMGICEHITVMDFGEVIARGQAREIQTNQQVIEAYLVQPASENH